MWKFKENRTVVAQLVQRNFARMGVEEEFKDESCCFCVCGRRLSTISSTW